MEQSSKAKAAFAWALGNETAYKVVLGGMVFFCVAVLCIGWKVFSGDPQWFKDTAVLLFLLGTVGGFGLTWLLGIWAGAAEEVVPWNDPTGRRVMKIAAVGFGLALALAITITVVNHSETANAARSARDRAAERDDRARLMSTPEMQAATENVERINELRRQATERKGKAAGQ
ncbi:MAG: hypothetical protein ACAI43_08030 [Phycisphaerae bacterium]|nr:hypothetical protein [Tepidisphaeraceae bacterium]